jgi:hypothetical protein
MTEADSPLQRELIPSYIHPNTYLGNHLADDGEDLPCVRVMVLLRMQILDHDPGSHHPDGVGDEVANSTSEDRGEDILLPLGEAPMEALMLEGFVEGEEE